MTPLELRSDCACRLFDGFLSASEAARLQRQLAEWLQWEQRAITLFGKPVLQPRLIAWAGTLPYTYSGLTLEPRPLDQPLEALRLRVCEQATTEFNHLLLNRYRDGADCMGWHSDNEAELGENPVVATLSLGARRRFLIKEKRRGDPPKRKPWSIELEPGSLLLMSGAFQHHYLHALPRQANVSAERISITFRRVLSA